MNNIKRLVIFAVLAAVLLCSGCNNNEGVIAYVNGEAVETAEFMMLASQYKAEVISYFARTYGAEYGSGFWQEYYSGENPGEMLTEKVMDKAVSTKLLQIEAKKNKIIKTCKYSDMIAQMEEENIRRAKDKADGKRVYGVVQYSASEYYNDRIAKIKISLLDKIKNERDITEEELREFYDTIKDEYYKKMSESVLTIFRFEPGGEEEARNLLEKAKRGENIDSQAAEMGAKLEAITVTADSERYVSLQMPGVLELIEEHQYPAYSELFTTGNGISFVRVDEVKDGQYKEYDEVSENVLSVMVERKLDDYLQEEQNNAKIKYTSEYDNINFAEI